MPDIFTFNSKGKKMVSPQRPIRPALTRNPKPIRAHIKANGGVSGSKVAVTNASYNNDRNKRTQSLGENRSGQRGRVMDVG